MTTWDRIQVQRKTIIKKKTKYSASLGLYRTTSTSSEETVSFSDDSKSDGPQAPDRSKKKKKYRMSKRRKQLIEDKLKTMDDIWAPECRPTPPAPETQIPSRHVTRYLHEHPGKIWESRRQEELRRGGVDQGLHRQKDEISRRIDNNLLTVEPRAVDPHCFDADPEPDPAQNLDADPDPDPGGGGRSAKNVHPPWQNPRYAPGYSILIICSLL
jgi:hypothetical protein